MEQQTANIVSSNEGNLRWFDHGSRICDKMNSRQSNDISMDKFWEGQWSSQMEGWASLAKHADVTNRYALQTCHSPSASESSFSVSTRDSPSLSAQSEASPIAGKYMLQSPDLSQVRFCKIPDTKHAKSSSMENVHGEFTEMDKQQDWMRLQERENIQCAPDLNGSGLRNKKLQTFVKAKERLVQSPISVVQSTPDVSDEGWLSDGTESWASASSQELSWNHLCEKTNDIHSLISQEASNIRPTSHFHGQGERGSGARERASHIAHSVTANSYDDEKANISKKHSYAEFNDERTLCDNEVPLQSRFDNRNSAPTLASPGSICLTKAQLGVHYHPEPHAEGLETRCFERCKSLGSRGHAGNLNVNMLSEPQEVDAYCRRNIDCSVEGHQETPVQVRDGHQPCARGLFKATNRAVQLQEHDFFVSNSTNNRSSTYMEPTSHTKQTHLKSRHSAAVEDKYPSSCLHGHFRFVEQDGSPCYSFSVHDSDEVFFARACQPESESNKEDHNFLYTFHSRRDEGKMKGGWKSLLKKEKLASSLVGKMIVSAKRMRTESRCTEETHFVLYGENSQLPVESAAYKNDQMSGQLDSKLLKPVSSSKSKLSMPTRGSHSQKLKQRDHCHMSVPGTTASQGIIRSCLHEPISRDEMSRQDSCDYIACCSKHSIIKEDIPTTQIEIAALVITTAVKEYKVTRKKVYQSSHKERNGDGWGAAFLEKGLKQGWGAGFLGKSSAVSSRPPVEDPQQQQPNTASKDAFKSDIERVRERTGLAETYHKSGSMSNEKLTQKMSFSKRKQPKIAVDVVVILPAGHHGLLRHDGDCPVEDGGSCGQTSLLECWRSGGNCDCGGWDMGCGLSVLKAGPLKLHKTTAPVALTSRDRINWISPGKPLQIFTQGCKQKKLLMLEIIQAGLFSLSFQARFSPLQAFATAVAIFHQQITRVEG